MIRRLRRRFILVSAAAVFLVLALIFALTAVLSISSTTRTLDTLAERISFGDGRFPIESTPPHAPSDHKHPSEPLLSSPETPFATRYFTVWLDSEGSVIRTNVDAIAAVGEQQAAAYAQQAVQGAARGWISSYRYGVFADDAGARVIFVDGSMLISSLLQSLVIVLCVLLGSGVLVVVLILLLSMRVMRPVAQSYEKQKQFITDANHELKTPLTLILANLDIAEAELGENEWLQDIRTEGEQMALLVNRLVELSRMDEEAAQLPLGDVAMSDVTCDVVSEFSAAAQRRSLQLTCRVEPALVCRGEERALRRLLSLLLDNAVKYCDEGGSIVVTLKRGLTALTLTVENDCRNAAELPLARLFDRFYRADPARQHGGYGIGLSTARAIVTRLRGEIVAYRKDDTHLGFRVTLRPSRTHGA